MLSGVDTAVDQTTYVNQVAKSMKNYQYLVINNKEKKAVRLNKILCHDNSDKDFDLYTSWLLTYVEI